MRHISLFEEQRQAMDKVETRIKRAMWSEETGLPPIAMLVPPIERT